MTAIDAAIVELEAHREHVSQFITELRRLSQVIEDAHEPPAPQVTTSTVTRHAAVIRHTSTPTNGTRPKASSPNDAKVLQALDVNEWRSLDTLTRRTKLVKGTIYGRLTRLEAAGSIESHKEGKRTVYRLVSQQPRPGAVAGTQAAPPVGPPPASGVPRADVQVVWNGSKERNGEVAMILPPREQRR